VLALPARAFETDLVTTVHSGKTLYVRFDFNDYYVAARHVT
jgi:hypothetical protein